MLGKPLGVGIYSAALKKGQLSPQGYAAMLASTTQLNTPGIAFGAMPAVHALTDVTGFGLLGHLLEICRASNAGATIEFARVPLHPGVLELAAPAWSPARRRATGPDARTPSRWRAPEDDVERALLTDPQTSGGLLVACAADAVDDVLAVFRDQGFADAAAIGSITAGAPRVRVD